MVDLTSWRARGSDQFNEFGYFRSSSPHEKEILATLFSVDNKVTFRTDKNHLIQWWTEIFLLKLS